MSRLPDKETKRNRQSLYQAAKRGVYIVIYMGIRVLKKVEERVEGKLIQYIKKELKED